MFFFFVRYMYETVTLYLGMARVNMYTIILLILAILQTTFGCLMFMLLQSKWIIMNIIMATRIEIELLLGLTTWVLRLRTWLLGFRMWLLGLRTWLLGLRTWLLGLRMRLLGLRTWILRLRMWLVGNMCP